MIQQEIPPTGKIMDPSTEAQAPRRRRLWLPSLGLRTSERLMMLAGVDVFLMIAALVVAVRTRTEWMDAPDAFLNLWRWWVALALVWWVVAQLTDAYDLARAASAPHSMLAAGGAALVTSLVYQMIPVFTPPLGSRGLSFLFAGLAVTGVALWRGLYAVLFVQPAFETRALVFGAGKSGHALAQDVSGEPWGSSPNPYRGTGYRIVGFVDDDPLKVGMAVAGKAAVIGTSGDLLELAQHLRVDEVVLAITNTDGMQQPAWDALMACRERGLRVTTMPTVYERVLGRVPVEYAGRNIGAVMPVEEGAATERLFWVAKRMIDIAFSVVALVPLALIIPLVALANLITSRGPLFYRQARVSRCGRRFSVVKFRTMRPNAEAATGAVWAIARDPRITPAGKALRRTRLDELPQVLNVLHGEMSVIGPRPERPEFVENLAQQIPFYKARHAVRPGLTGWAQVRFGYGNSVGDARTKLEYDLYYVRHASFYLDTLIVLKTAAVMFKLQGK